LDFINHTFFAYQYGASQVAHVIERVLDFLKQEDMVRQQGERLVATPFGERISWLYIDPKSGVTLRDGLKRAQQIQPTAFSFLHLICSTPDMELLYPRRRDYPELGIFAAEHEDEFLTHIPDEYSEPEAYEYFLAEVKTALMLQMWIDEAPEDGIHERFGVGAGDIRRAVDTADWLLYSAQELAKLFKIKGVVPMLRDLRKRVRYGVKEELLELVELRGIGRVRGRSLYRAGYRRLADIKKADIKELAQVPHIGLEIAKSIKQQLDRGFEEAHEEIDV
ncbi:MAG: helix-hairpin-helix domain-containing protein, partial [Hadesarchaea archaeon]|nr:helix-hairpin-helix domain-containing protein [Hadesarchaea archaeon]